MSRDGQVQSRRRLFTTRLVLSAILLSIAFGLFLYWSWGMPLPGDVIEPGRISRSYLLRYALVPLVILIVGLLTAPWDQKMVRDFITRKTLTVLGLSALGVSLLSCFVPFPPVTPPCCMVGPMRERGLPITYIIQEKPFSDEDGPWRGPEDEFGDQTAPIGFSVIWFSADVTIWALYLFYGTYFRKSLKLRKNRI